MANFQFCPTHDAKAATALVDAALAANMLISVNDGEEWTVKQSRDRAEILAAMNSTDADTLRFRTGDGDRVGDAWLIWGNGPGETVADHTDCEPMRALLAKAGFDIY